MTQPKFKVKKGDVVQIVVGKAKRTRGVVVRVHLDSARVEVSGVHEMTRHIRPSAQHPEGTYTVNKLIHISNVAVVDVNDAVDPPSRIGYRFNEDGEKVRFFKKTGKEVVSVR
ncbi:MAG: 50S ribosomal protein L24 [Holosporales bacterium]|nr:50S ribosomal protein L24 [Holosporales bacterium]